MKYATGVMSDDWRIRQWLNAGDLLSIQAYFEVNAERLGLRERARAFRRRVERVRKPTKPKVRFADRHKQFLVKQRTVEEREAILAEYNRQHIENIRAGRGGIWRNPCD